MWVNLFLRQSYRRHSSNPRVLLKLTAASLLFGGLSFKLFIHFSFIICHLPNTLGSSLHSLPIAAPAAGCNNQEGPALSPCPFLLCPFQGKQHFKSKTLPNWWWFCKISLLMTSLHLFFLIIIINTPLCQWLFQFLCPRHQLSCVLSYHCSVITFGETFILK